VQGSNDQTKSGFCTILASYFWAFLWGVFLSLFVDSVFFNLTMDEVNQTMWALTGPWLFLWAFGVPLASIVVAIGICSIQAQKEQ
jgi:hypothetical protein